MNRYSGASRSKYEAAYRALEAGAARTSPGPWRLVIDGAGEAAWNMALDEALLSGVIANSSPPTVRLYRWQRPALTAGRFQNLSRTINLEACRQHDVPIVRRITGGRSILHGTDLTVSISAKLIDLGIRQGAARAVEIYELTAAWFVAAFAGMGVEARPGSCVARRGQERVGNCFDIVSRADIVETMTGRKVFGSALHLRGDAVLQQISIPVDGKGWVDDGLSARIFGVAAPAPSRYAATPPRYAATPRGHSSIVCNRIMDCLVQVLHTVLAGVEPDGVLTSQEQVDASHLLRSRYQCKAWNQDGVQAVDAGSN